MGKRPNRETVIEPTTPRASTVPTAGTGRNRPRPGRPDGAAAAGLSNAFRGRSDADRSIAGTILALTGVPVLAQDPPAASRGPAGDCARNCFTQAAGRKAAGSRRQSRAVDA